MITKAVIQFDLAMKLLQVTIVIFLFFFSTEAQNTFTTSHGSPVIQPSIAIIIGVLAVVFVVTLLIFLYTKYCHRSVSDLLSPRHTLHHLLQSRSSLSGIDKSVIESIPFFTFSSLKGSKEGLECSICLSIFEESEVLRLLPKCKHAFHMNCIDEWLESHSNCPLCRYKFDSTDFTSYNYTNSLRYNGNPSPPNLMVSHLELFVEREEDRHGSTRFNFGNNFRKLSKSKNEDCLAIEGDIGKKLHKFKHKIIVSDIFHKRRWSDLSSSDLLLLNSEMLNVVSSKRFHSISPKHGFLLNEQLEKIKEDMDRKRIFFESKRGTINQTRSVSGSSTFSPSFGNEENTSVDSRLVKSSEKRSMSEITILTRCKDFSVQSNRTTEPSSLGNNSRDEQIRKLWLPIARRTLQWFAVRENNFEKFNTRMYTSNV